jgi:hypothetical protein
VTEVPFTGLAEFITMIGGDDDRHLIFGVLLDISNELKHASVKVIDRCPIETAEITHIIFMCIEGVFPTFVK